MPSRSYIRTSNLPDSRDIGDLDQAAMLRRKAVWNLTMSERLARMHELCRQMSAVKGAARVR
jgi:hypothetical protein